jgi:hypothetical protein
MDKENRRSPNSSPLHLSQSPSNPSISVPTADSVRILRLAERLSLSVETLERIKAKIFGPQGLEVSAIEAMRAPELSPDQDAASALNHAYPLVVTAGDTQITTLPIVDPSMKSMRSPDHTLQQAAPRHQLESAAEDKDIGLEDEILLRKKIEASPNFAHFRSDAWRLLEKYPRPEIAARLIELALMYGTAEDLAYCLQHLDWPPGEYFPFIADQMREQVLLRLWTSKQHVLMDQTYFRKDFILKLMPVERWYLTWSLVDNGKHDRLYHWYRRNQHEIWAMQKQFGSRIQKSDTELRFAIGSAAFRMDDEDLAMQMLESIPQSAPEFARAIDLLLDVRVDRDERGLSSYEARLSRELDWNDRIGLLDSFLLRAQKLEQLLPKDRAALNTLLADPLRWFPDSPDAVHLVAQTVLKYADLEPLLPNVLKVFRDHAQTFQKPAFEHALWAPVQAHVFKHPEVNAFWRSIALLHGFAVGLGQDEKMLWEARDLYAEAQTYAGQSKTLPHSWSELHKALVQWVSKSDRLDEVSRKRLTMIAKLCGESREVSEEDIHAYLAAVREPHLDILETMIALARARRQEELELFILSHKAKALHHTNQALARIWEIGAALKKNDLSWRAATLLHIRQRLAPEVEKAWLIVGEKRREFPFHDLSETQLKIIYANFEGNEQKLVEAVATVGPLIPELLASLNPHLVALKRTKAISKTEAEVSEYLESVEWLTKPKKQFSLGTGGLWQTRPPFFSNLTEGKWCGLFIGLSQRLGLNAWDWQLSLLSQQIEALIPRMTRSSETMQASKVGRWLRSLSAVQRKAWYDLAQVSKKFEDESAQEVLGRFLAILTTTIYQDHIGALSTLERVRAPLRLRWDTENWMISKDYTEIRMSLGSQAIARLPDNVYRMTALSPEPPRMRS